MAFANPLVTIELKEYNYLKNIETQSKKDNAIKAIKLLAHALLFDKSYKQPRELYDVMRKNGIEIIMDASRNGVGNIKPDDITVNFVEPV